jgi:predicted Ser/Thr protein kinase
MTGPADRLALALDDFQQSRSGGRPLTIREVLDRVVPIDGRDSVQDRAPLLPELIKMELDFHWGTTRDQPPEAECFLETYLEEFADVPLGDEALLELIEHEYCLRHQYGDWPELVEYASRFPRVSDAACRRLKSLRDDLLTESSIRSLLTTPELMATPEGDDPAGAGPSPTSQPASPEAIASLAEVLCRIRPFTEVSQHAREAVARHAEVRQFAAGEVLLRQGDAANGLLIMLDGTANVTVEEQGRVHTIARLTRHTVVGEMAFVTHEARSASVVAASRGSAATIGKADFERVAGRYPRLSVALAELMAERVGNLSIDVLCGKTIGRYEIRRRLGRGAMGIVYAAAEQGSGRPVALKMLRHDLTLDRLASQRFHQEAEIVRELRHPNIVQVFDEFSTYGTSFIAMELCDGPSLGDLIAHVGPLPEAAVQAVTGQIAAGLRKAHRAGVAHRDLKPSNVLFTRAGTAKLADFGLARCLSTDLAALTAYGQIVGTPRYMAPEQLSGERGDERSDLYALGCIVYEALVGHPVYRAERFNALLKERALWSLPGSDAIRPGLDRSLYELLKQSLDEDPDVRYVDLDELAEWAAPVDLAALGVVCPESEPTDAARGAATVREGGAAI